jgi:hypothetical protein
MTRLLVIASLIWAGSASAQIKGGGYEIDPEPKRPDLQPRSHRQAQVATATYKRALLTQAPEMTGGAPELGSLFPRSV